MTAQAGEFGQYWISDAAGVLTEISAYVTNSTLPRQSASTDLTTFATGGGPVTNNIIRGAAQSVVTLTLLFDPVVVALIEQLWGGRGGATFQHWAGKNAQPTSGDQVFQGTMTLTKFDPTYNAGAVATIAITLQPTDGGAIVPGWSAW
jgi:hypothetical protein